MNALDNFERASTYGRNDLTDVEKEGLISRCKNGIRKIIQKEGINNKYLVLSDSKVFLSHIADLPVVILDSTKIGHIGLVNDEESTLKTFVDFYLLSKANAVFRILAPELFSNTCFSMFASVMGNVPFETEYV